MNEPVAFVSTLDELGDGPAAVALTSKAAGLIAGHLSRNEIDSAVRLYEQSKGTVAPQLLIMATSSGTGTQQAMAHMFTRARDYLNAARVCELALQVGEAAALFELAGDFESAARCYHGQGDMRRAGAAYERAGLVDDALKVYEAVGAHDAMVQCLSRQQRFFDAASVYRNLGDLHSEVDMLQRVPMSSAQRVYAARRLSVLLHHFGHTEQAIQLLADTVTQAPAAKVDQTIHLELLRLLEAHGRLDHAAQMRAYFQSLFGTAVPATLPAPPSPSLPPPGQLAKAQSPQGDPFDALLDQALDDASKGLPAQDPYASLKSISLFADLTLVDMQDLFRISTQVTYPPNTVIIEQGTAGSGITVIVRGEVDVLKMTLGGSTQLARLGAGAYVGEISIIDSAPTSARVITVTEVLALFISKDAFTQFLYTRDTAALRIMRVFTRTLADRLRAANLRI